MLSTVSCNMEDSYVKVLVLIASLLQNSTRSVAKIAFEDGSRQNSTKVKLSIIQSEYIQLNSHRNTDKSNKVIRDITRNDKSSENNNSADLSKKRLGHLGGKRRDDEARERIFKRNADIRTTVKVKNKSHKQIKSRRFLKNVDQDTNYCRYEISENILMKKKKGKEKSQLLKKKNNNQTYYNNQKNKRIKIDWMKNKIKLFTEIITREIEKWYNENKNCIGNLKCVKILKNIDKDLRMKKILLKINSLLRTRKKMSRRKSDDDNQDFLTKSLMHGVKNWLEKGRSDTEFLSLMKFLRK